MRFFLKKKRKKEKRGKTMTENQVLLTRPWALGASCSSCIRCSVSPERHPKSPACAYIPAANVEIYWIIYLLYKRNWIFFSSSGSPCRSTLAKKNKKIWSIPVVVSFGTMPSNQSIYTYKIQYRRTWKFSFGYISIVSISAREADTRRHVAAARDDGSLRDLAYARSDAGRQSTSDFCCNDDDSCRWWWWLDLLPLGEQFLWCTLFQSIQSLSPNRLKKASSSNGTARRRALGRRSVNSLILIKLVLCYTRDWITQSRWMLAK